MKRALLFTLLTLFTSALALAQVCPHAYKSLGWVNEKLDAEFNAIPWNFDRDQKAAAKSALLNRAFFPMLLKLEDDISNMTAKEIRARVKALKEKYPLKKGEFGNGRFATTEHAQANHYIEFNSEAATRYYGMDTNPMAYRRDKFHYVMPDEERVKEQGIIHNMFGTVLTPVGEYGEKFADDMLRTTQVMMDIADKNLSGMSKEMWENSHDLLLAGATRVKNATNEYAKVEQGAKSAAIEGILSFHQLVTMVAGLKIPGLETGEDVLRAFVKGGSGKLGLTSELTMNYPMALVGPSTNAGYGFKGALEMKNGKLQITDAFKAQSNGFKKVLERYNHPKAVCPVSSYWRKPSSEGERHQKTGLQHVAEQYLKIYEVVSNSK